MYLLLRNEDQFQVYHVYSDYVNVLRTFWMDKYLLSLWMVERSSLDVLQVDGSAFNGKDTLRPDRRSERKHWLAARLK